MYRLLYNGVCVREADMLSILKYCQSRWPDFMSTYTNAYLGDIARFWTSDGMCQIVHTLEVS